MKYLKKFNESTFEFSPEDLADCIDQKPNNSPENKHHTLPNEGDEEQKLQDGIDQKPNNTPENKHHTLPNEGDEHQELQDDDEIKDGISLPKTSEIPNEDVLHEENIITRFANFKLS